MSIAVQTAMRLDGLSLTPATWWPQGHGCRSPLPDSTLVLEVVALRAEGANHILPSGKREWPLSTPKLGRHHGRQVRMVVHRQAITGKVHGPWSV